MNRIHPKALLNSKWTAVRPGGREKHFAVTEVEFDETQSVILCLIEAVISRRAFEIDWHELRDPERWRQGWH